METFRSDIRHIVLKIKSYEESLKRCKENLANELRKIQNYPISTLKSFAPYTKQILCEIKIFDEENKSFREDLRILLTKIKNLPNEKEENDPVETIKTHCPITATMATDQRTSVNFNNFLTVKLNKFTDEVTTIRHNETTRAVYIQAFSCILRNFQELPDLRKIKCKIKG